MSLFDIAKLEQELSELEEKTANSEFWTTNNEETKKVLSEIKRIKSKVIKYRELEKEINDSLELSEMIKESFEEELLKDIIKNTKKEQRELERLELETLLSGKYDANNAIVTIHPGAGGTESQDWAEMLYRMYTRWATKNEYEVKELDYLEGEEAGIKSVTFEVIGQNAYGYMKSEKGVHRLVRISPFDSGGRRHTSFASIEVLPEITEDIELDILQNLNKGKECALKEIYRLFFHALCAFGTRFVKNDAAVVDIVQEVFIKVWARRTDFQSIYSLRSFMYLSVRNACLNYNRDYARVRKISFNDSELETFAEVRENDFMIEEDVHRQIRNEVERLPEAMRKVFNLTLLDMSIPEIAKTLDISENTVRNQRARAREILRARLKDKIFFLLLLCDIY